MVSLAITMTSSGNTYLGKSRNNGRSDEINVDHWLASLRPNEHLCKLDMATLQRARGIDR